MNAALEIVRGIVTAALFVVAHEFGHYVAAKVLRLNPTVRISGLSGRTVFDPPASRRADVIVSLAGPVGHLLAIAALAPHARSALLTAHIMATCLARNLAPFANSDGDRLLGAGGARGSRQVGYWILSASLLFDIAAHREPIVLIEQISSFDVWIRKGQRWLQAQRLRNEIRRTKITL